MNKTIKILILTLVGTICSLFPVEAQQIGSWKAYPAYGDLDQIEVAGDIVYAISEGSLFAYNTNDQSIQTFSKMDLLNDCDIEMIRWCPTPKLLMILYSNGDIDFLSRSGNVSNLSAYQNHSTALDKTVNSLTPVGNNVLMATNFGIVEVNATEAYVVDTYSLGYAVNDAIKLNNHIYAVTAQGIIEGNCADNLLDPSSWTVINTGVFTQIAYLDNQMFAIRSGNCSTLNTATGETTQLFNPYYTNYWAGTERIIMSGGDYTCVVSGKNTYFALHELHGAMAHSSGDEYYTSDSDGKLTMINMQRGQLPSLTTMTGVRPDGPRSSYFGFLKYKNGKLLCGTGWRSSVDGAVQILQNGEWTILPDDMEATTGARYYMTMAVDEDPNEAGHLMVGTASGLYEFRNGAFSALYSIDNSPIQAVAGTATDKAKNSVYVPGVVYDSSGTLWFTNGYSTTTSLFSMEGSGSITSHHHSDFLTSQGWSMFMLGSMIEDSRGLLWMGNNNSYTPALVCYQPSTDGVKAYKSFINQDGATVELWYVRCVAEDQEGNIWVGTDAGPIMLTASDVSSGSDVFTQVKVPRDDGTNLADYLLSGEDVTAIAVDKANRKWIGTNGGGVYVISPDNMTQLYHFTSSNSELLSDYIEALAIDASTGEVYIGTSYGLCSYQSDISVMPDKMDKSTTWAYPNPVEPDFTGNVTICGLSYGADVKIVTSAGTLVCEGTSSGGTFEWDCRDQKGRRVASGIYMVETAERDGSAGCVCKIAVIN